MSVATTFVHFESTKVFQLHPGRPELKFLSAAPAYRVAEDQPGLGQHGAIVVPPPPIACVWGLLEDL